MTQIRKLLRTDGTSVELPGRLSLAEIRALIGAETTDTVSLHHLGSPLHVLVIDDRGYEVRCVDKGSGELELRPMRALKPVNVEATRLYHANCRPGTTHQIVGDAVVLPDDDFA